MKQDCEINNVPAFITTTPIRHRALKDLYSSGIWWGKILRVWSALPKKLRRSIIELFLGDLDVFKKQFFRIVMSDTDTFEQFITTEPIRCSVPYYNYFWDNGWRVKLRVWRNLPTGLQRSIKSWLHSCCKVPLT